MKINMVKVEPCWVRLDGCYGRLSTTIKAGVRPANRRRWNHEHGVWEIHWHWLNTVAEWARGLDFEVDWSALPDRWQMAAAGAAVSDSLAFGMNPEPSPYEELYVTEKAPDEVVAAAYKALALKHHPDVGGDADQFRRIDVAYKKILEKRKA